VEQNLTNGSMHRESRERFSRLSRKITRGAGSLVPAALSVVFVLSWLVVGVVIAFPDWWQTVLTETSAAVTLTMLFIIQHTNNRESHATALKLDELIHAIAGAEEKVAGIEHRELEEQEQMGQAPT
jgi:low affinity Fe/Cu permease